MGRGFQEVAHLRGDDNKFKENFSKIDWSAHSSDNHIVNKLTDETIKKAEQLKDVIQHYNAERNSISLNDGDTIISHEFDENRDFKFTIEIKSTQKTLTVDVDTFDTIGEELGVFAEAFVKMYFELAHRDRIDRVKG